MSQRNHDAEQQLSPLTASSLTVMLADADGASSPAQRFRSTGQSTIGDKSSTSPPYGSPGLVVSGGIVARHLEGFNIGFADGHVKWYKSDESAASKSRVYNAATPFSMSKSSPTFAVN